jgi:hypothetical protein
MFMVNQEIELNFANPAMEAVKAGDTGALSAST